MCIETIAYIAASVADAAGASETAASITAAATTSTEAVSSAVALADAASTASFTGETLSAATTLSTTGEALAATGATFAGIGTALSAVSAVTGAMGQMQSAKAQKQNLNFQAQVASANSQIQQQNAELASQTGTAIETQQQLKNRATMGGILAAQGANGLDVNSPSAINIRSGAETMGNLDVNTIKNEYARQAWGFGAQSSVLAQESAMEKSQAKQEMSAGYVNAGSSLLSGAGSAAKSYAMFESTGLF